jgi:hypothetical protein
MPSAGEHFETDICFAGAIDIREETHETSS